MRYYIRCAKQKLLKYLGLQLFSKKKCRDIRRNATFKILFVHETVLKSINTFSVVTSILFNRENIKFRNIMRSRTFCIISYYVLYPI